MVMPVLKCPYLAQLTLQQVRASAPYILNAGAESCPIFGQFARKISTTGVTNTLSVNISSSSISFDEIQAVHEKIHGRKPSNKAKFPTSSNPFGQSKTRVCFHLKSFLIKYLFAVIISSKCDDILCPFLKTTPIALRRVNLNQDAIVVNQPSG
jgi:hypothetical protein